MNRKLKLILVPFLALVFSACGAGGSAGGSGGTSGGGSGGGGAVACMGTSITANEANDYSFSSTLTLPPIKVQPKTNLTFDWGGVTVDMVGHTVDPKKDLNTILIFEWNLTLDQLQEKANKDYNGLQSTDMTATPPLSLTTNGTDTSAKLLDFGINGCQIGAACGLLSVDQAMDYFDPSKFDPATHIFTMMAATGKVLGKGTEMIQSFQLDSSSSNTTVTMTNDSTKLTYKANLHALAPTGIPAGKAGITLDWGMMTTNALGDPFDTTAITRAIVAHYTQSPTELEGRFLDLELIATDLFDKTDLAGTKVDFSTLANKSGNAFSGIDGNGTWLAVLQCGGCRNPAPWYLTVLKPCN